VTAVTEPDSSDGSERPERPEQRPAWRRVGLVVVLLALGALLVDNLGDLTQSRPDHVHPQSRSEIVLEVDTRGYQQPEADAVRNLWAACSGTTTRRLLDDPGFVPVGDDEFRFTVQPGLGPNTERKLVGCLEDATLDRVSAEVESVELIDP
jgi:hypothetical protein